MVQLNCQCLGSLNIVPFSMYMLTLLRDQKRYLPTIIFACTQDDMGKQLGKTVLMHITLLGLSVSEKKGQVINGQSLLYH